MGKPSEKQMDKVLDDLIECGVMTREVNDQGENCVAPVESFREKWFEKLHEKLKEMEPHEFSIDKTRQDSVDILIEILALDYGYFNTPRHEDDVTIAIMALEFFTGTPYVVKKIKEVVETDKDWDDILEDLAKMKESGKHWAEEE